jgi:hypothetical protein
VRAPSGEAPTPRALVRGAVASALLLALGGLADPQAPPPPAVVPPAGAARGTAGMTALCGTRTVPEGAACVPLPAPGVPLDEGAAAAALVDVPHRASSGARAPTTEHLPRRPERPAEALAYVYPIGSREQPPAFLSPHEPSLQADDRARNAAPPRLDPPRSEPSSWASGVDLVAARGERVEALALDAQEGDAEVVFVGELFGVTVATAHTVHEPGQTRRVLVLYGHLDRPGPGVVPGAHLASGAAVGFAGDSGVPGLVALHLEARQVRSGASLSDLTPTRMADAALTIPCDLRNVLPRR